MKVLLVPGTHGYRGAPAIGQWWYPGSPFESRLRAEGIDVVGETRPFVWTTDLTGLMRGKVSADWRAGGENLYAYAVPPLCPDRRIKPEDLTIICHSHGLQVVLFAAAAGLKIARLISVCSPVRDDMAVVAGLARPNIARWMHTHSSRWSDHWAWLGTWFDGNPFSAPRRHPLADFNIDTKDAGHTGILDDQARFPEWTARGWFSFLKGEGDPR